MKVLLANPADAPERPKVTQGKHVGLGGDQIHKLPVMVPTTSVGLREQAINELAPDP